MSPESPLEAVVLIKRTGALLGAWTRDGVPLNVISVMAATLIGSVEVMVEAARYRSPECVRIETDECRVMALKTSPQTVLVAMAPAAVRREDVQREVLQIAAELRRGAARADRPTPAVVLAGLPKPATAWQRWYPNAR